MPNEHDETHEEYQADQDEINENDVYMELYGFEHDCHCADDWAEGNWAVVSQCYVNMAGQALAHLEEVNKELSTLKAEIVELRMAGA